MLRIHKTERDGLVVLELSGRLKAEHGPEIKGLMENESRHIALDLREVRLVDSSAVKFLAIWESNGVELLHCPGYIREWVSSLKERVETMKRAFEDENGSVT